MAVTSSTSAASSTSSTTSATATSKARIAGNFDTFLTLLTTQLKNQDPTSPLDTNQFTQQLVQFAQVEQQINQNESLNKLLNVMQTSQPASALGYIGRTVSYDSSKATPSASGANWSFDTPETGTYMVRVKDKDGNIVAQGSRDLTQGASSFNWAGTRADGKAIGTDPYTLELVRNSTTVPVLTSGKVSTVDTADGTTTLSIGSQKIPASSVRSISL
jgi:flagellar basal-body rod modification protein FlgD